MEFSGADFSSAYGESAGGLLAQIAPSVASAAAPFTDAFYEALDRSGTLAEIIARVEPEEFEAMKARQAEYIVEMVSPDLTMLTHQTNALRAGRVHALVGVDMQWLVESHAHYQHLLAQLIAEQLPLSSEREQLLRAVNLRAFFDLREQSAGYRSVSRDVAVIQSRVHRVIATTGNLFDMVQGVLDALHDLPGDVSGFFARADERSDLQIEATVGAAARYHEAMQAGQIPKISIDPSVPAGQGPTGRSWRTGNVVISNAWTLEPDRTPWLSVGKTLGFRSGAAVPLVDEAGKAIAMISLYSAFPGYFSTSRVSKLLGLLRDVLSQAALVRLGGPVIPLRDRQRYRQLLDHNKVIVRYQPIIDLRTGELDRIEALARLQDHTGAVVPPNDFLSALGEQELFTLFARVARQSCVDWVYLVERGLRTRIAINVPAQALCDMRYLDAILTLLEEHDIPPQAFVLEVLETQGDAADVSRRETFIERLRESGIEIEQDDLGSGHSSLVRMDRYPFDAVKIDQELVRGALRNPQRALEFVLYLTRLAHALATPVTVEGLENHGLIEAAAVLGADRGQGFGIATPLPANELLDWHRDYVFPVDPQTPRTALGAMAAYLMWDLQLAKADSVVEHFVSVNRLQGSTLDGLLQQSRVAAREGAQSEAYQRTRTQIISSLRKYWLTQG